MRVQEVKKVLLPLEKKTKTLISAESGLVWGPPLTLMFRSLKSQLRSLQSKLKITKKVMRIMKKLSKT